MAYYRKGDKTLLVVGNYQKEPQTIELAGECRKVLINNYDNVAMDGRVISSLLLRCSRRKKNGNPGMICTWIFVLFVSMNYSNLL